MLSSPFPHQGPLAPELVTGRDDLIADLVERLTARRVTALLGPRRFGKTSVLRRVQAEIEEAGANTIWLDLYEVTSPADLAIRLDHALHRSRGRVREAVEAISASIGFAVGGVNLSFAKPSRPDPIATLHVLVDLLVEVALRHPTTIFIDEFSSIAAVPGAAGLLRTGLQHHYDDIGLVFAGSQPSTMQLLFADSEQPFYGQADLVTIPPLSAAAINQIVHDGFTTTERDPGPLGTLLFARCNGHPRRSMQYADATWHRAEPGGPWDDRSWEQAVADVEGASAPANETLFSVLPSAEQKVLRILADGGSPYGRDAELLKLAPTSAQRAIASLVNRGAVADFGDGLELVDPVLGHWLRATLPITNRPS